MDRRPRAPNALGGQNYVGDLDAVFRWPETIVWTTGIFLYTTILVVATNALALTLFDTF